MSDVAHRLCARLVRQGAIPREEARELDLPEVRQEVEATLSEVGLELATSVYSEHVGVRLVHDVTLGPGFDAATNVGLRSDGCALLVILWARLVLQKRTAADRRETPGQASLLPGDAARAARDFTPTVQLETLVREFGDILGARTHVRQLVSQLRRLGFAAGRGDTIEAGPFLELGIDGERMVAFIRRGVLSRLAETPETRGEGSGEPDPAETLLPILLGIDGGAAMAELRTATGEEPELLRRRLKALEAQGLVRRDGERRATRYHLTAAGGDRARSLAAEAP